MSTRRSISIAGVFVAVAVALSVLVPTEQQQQEPYVQQVSTLGERVDARTFSVTVVDVRLADRVQTPEWTGTTTGVWLVVDIEFERTIDRGPISGSFRIGDTTFELSRRPGTASIDGGAASLPGLPIAGSMLVELPLSALEAPGADRAVIRFTTAFEPRLDGVVDYTFDLGALDHEGSVTVFEPERMPS